MDVEHQKKGEFSMNKNISDINLSINWTAMIKPAQYKLIQDTDNNNAATFEIEPLERGYSTTLGNCLRRVLMSSLYGTAIAAFKIEGVSHEYSTIEHVKEDVIEIVLNMKSITFKGNLGYETKKCFLHVNHQGNVTAGMIDTCEGVEITNPEQIICTTTKNIDFKIEIIIKSGKGYIAANEHQDFDYGFIKIDTLFSPIKNCSFQAEASRIGSKTEYDKLVLNIETNGAIDPELALGLASKILQNQLQAFISFKDVKEIPKPTETKLPFNKNLLKKVVDQELSVRSQNCLKIDNITYLGDLVTKSEAQMLKTPNFGRKSLNEIKQILQEYGLSFGMSIPEWPPENIEELITKYLESDR